MWALENSVIHVGRAAQSLWMTDFPDLSTWMTEFSVTRAPALRWLLKQCTPTLNTGIFRIFQEGTEKITLSFRFGRPAGEKRVYFDLAKKPTGAANLSI
jgi:hypothetical protein